LRLEVEIKFYTKKTKELEDIVNKLLNEKQQLANKMDLSKIQSSKKDLKQSEYEKQLNSLKQSNEELANKSYIEVTAKNEFLSENKLENET